MIEESKQRPGGHNEGSASKKTPTKFLEISAYKSFRVPELKASKSQDARQTQLKCSRTIKAPGKTKKKEKGLVANRPENFSECPEYFSSGDFGEDSPEKKISFLKMSSSVSNQESNSEDSLVHNPSILAFLTENDKNNMSHVSQRGSYFSLAVNTNNFALKLLVVKGDCKREIGGAECEPKTT